uniref:RNase H type-1 domain-containing protein n=1 Tax=Quercus lobata TaxID=97700 RepID=A0A7N2LS53_QUELO
MFAKIPILLKDHGSARSTLFSHSCPRSFSRPCVWSKPRRSMAEAEAVNCAIKLSANLDFVAIFIESDSKVVVEALPRPEHEIPWRILITCLDMSYLLSQYPSIHVSWVPRTSNGAAHSLVKWSLNHNVFGFFDIGCCPLCFESINRVEASNYASL